MTVPIFEQIYETEKEINKLEDYKKQRIAMWCQVKGLPYTDFIPAYLKWKEKKEKQWHE